MTIRPATVQDYPALLEMIKELALFEKAPEKVTNTVEQMMAEDQHFRCFIVENEAHEIAGMALFFIAYYTWIGKSLYLDDLYIKEAYRGQGIGTRLLNKIFDIARDENCKRVRWQVLDWNAPAIALYKKAGATIDNAWSNCDFDQTGITDFNL